MSVCFHSGSSYFVNLVKCKRLPYHVWITIYAVVLLPEFSESRLPQLVNGSETLHGSVGKKAARSSMFFSELSYAVHLATKSTFYLMLLVASKLSLHA